MQNSEVSARLLWKLSDVLETSESRKALSSLQSDGAQLMVDFLHSVLLEPAFPTTWLRKHSLIALYKLSKASLLYPHCYILKDIIFGSYESGGAFSDVHKGRYGEYDLCLKVIRLHQKSDTEAMLKIYAKEAIIWSQLHHPNIAPFYGIYYLNEERKQVCLVSPWMHKGNLVDYLKHNPSVSRPPFVHDVATGLEYLHSQNLIHGDIKGVNVLVNDSERACITDFGLSFIRTDHTLAYSIVAATTRGFSYRWAAPELLEDGACATPASDVWAFGCVCYEILTGLLPFHGSTDPQVFRKLMKGELPARPPDLGEAESVVWGLVDRCWDMEPADRPTCLDISQELKQKGLAREQVDDLEGGIAQGKQTFLDAMRKSEEVPIDLDRVERILNEVHGFPETKLPSVPEAGITHHEVAPSSLREEHWLPAKQPGIEYGAESTEQYQKSRCDRGPSAHPLNGQLDSDEPSQLAADFKRDIVLVREPSELTEVDSKPQENSHKWSRSANKNNGHTQTPPSSANQLSSLYQQCSSLRSRLWRLRGFSYYIELATIPDSRQSTDPVAQLRELFSIGISLCYIFDQLPAEAGFIKMNHSEYNQEAYEINPDREKKHAIALFAMQIRSTQFRQAIPECEPFTVRDIWDRDYTDGLVKAIKTVTAIVDYLSPSAFNIPPPSPPSLAANVSSDNISPDPLPQPANPQEQAMNNIIREMVETERKYVQDLETMQKYSNALAQKNLIDQDTIHLLFPNLNKLLNFQRKFLIRLERTAEAPLQDQRWGLPFIENEGDFVVYETYCANYTNASELMLTHERSLMPLNHLINVKSELPAFLIRPLSRVCKYPLLLDFLIKTLPPATHFYYEELNEGLAAAKRIADRINETPRRTENAQIVKNLSSRIDDWKGHRLENFGDLLLDDLFTVTKAGVDREYHVFLFEKVILCCKEVLPKQQSENKIKRINAVWKKQTNTPTPNQRRNTPLLLKGRIFLSNITLVVPPQPRASTSSGMTASYPLVVWWKGEDYPEYFIFKCRNEEQMCKWESQINRLRMEATQGRDRNVSQPNRTRQRGKEPSQTTGDNPEYSPNSSSPVTPLKPNNSSLGDVGDQGTQLSYVKLKVYFHEDIFVLQVPRVTKYDDLVEKLWKKVRLCGPRREDGPLRVMYRDEDGDLMSVGSTEDLEIAFKEHQHGTFVTLVIR